MGTNPLSSLAQKAKEAAAKIEDQINESLAEDGVGGDGNNDGPDDGTTGTGSGWEKCDDNISSDFVEEEEEKDSKQLSEEQKNKPQEMSYVDVTATDIPKNETTVKPENNSELLVALARIDVLEKQVNALKDELASARELSENYQATNLLMQQQVNELQEENETLKKSAASEKSTED